MNLVVGGTGDSNFYLAKTTKFITNWNFEVDLTGWTGVPGAGDISQYEDSLTFWGEYSMKVDASVEAGTYAKAIIETGSELWERAFILEFAVRVDEARDIKIFVQDVDGYQTFTQTYTGVTGEFVHFFYYFIFLPLGSPIIGPTELEIRLYGTDTVPGISYYDNVNLYEITEKISFRVPETFEALYEKELQSKFELITGRIQEYLRGWRFIGNLGYQYLTKEEEEKRTRIGESDLMIFQPHDDNEFMVVSMWNGNFARNYFGDIYAGHTGNINLMGAHLINEPPA